MNRDDFMRMYEEVVANMKVGTMDEDDQINWYCETFGAFLRTVKLSDPSDKSARYLAECADEFAREAVALRSAFERDLFDPPS